MLEYKALASRPYRHRRGMLVSQLENLLGVRAPARRLQPEHLGVALLVLRRPARPGCERREEHPCRRAGVRHRERCRCLRKRCKTGQGNPDATASETDTPTREGRNPRPLGRGGCQAISPCPVMRRQRRSAWWRRSGTIRPAASVWRAVSTTTGPVASRSGPTAGPRWPSCDGRSAGACWRPDAPRPGSEWWRAVNEGLLRDAWEADQLLAAGWAASAPWSRTGPAFSSGRARWPGTGLTTPASSRGTSSTRSSARPSSRWSASS